MQTINARDMLVVAIDPARLTDPEFVPEGDPERLRVLAGRFSREELLRAFDVLAKAEVDMRTAAYIVAINRVATVTRMRGMYA